MRSPVLHVDTGRRAQQEREQLLAEVRRDYPPEHPFMVERRRQIEQEGWTVEHDDQHHDGTMLRAAMVYRMHAIGYQIAMVDGRPLGWPWDAAWWKPKSPRRDLIRAGALAIAEIERLHRAGRPFVHAVQKLDLFAADLAALPPEASA